MRHVLHFKHDVASEKKRHFILSVRMMIISIIYLFMVVPDGF